MDEFYFILIIAGVVVLALLFFFSSRPSADSKSNAQADYAAGLNYMVSGDRNLALQKLRDAVRKDTDNIDAYIKIGDLLRESGYVDQAIKIHRDLTARTSLEVSEQLLILRSLEADFEAKQSYDAALKVLERIYALKKDDLWAREKELHLYELMQDWKRAEETYRKLTKNKKNIDRSRIANYRLEMGKQHEAAGKMRDAREAYRAAMKAAPFFFPGYQHLCDNYIREDRPSDALTVLKNFMQTNPDQAAKAFSRTRELLFKIGEFGEIENIYQQVIDNSPENWEAYLALAEVKEKKGELQKSIELCQHILQRNPDYSKAREYLVRYYHRRGNDKLAVEQALALINISNRREKAEVAA